jgi:hypothetical protein
MFDGLQARSSGLMRKYPSIAFIYRVRAETQREQDERRLATARVARSGRVFIK